MVLRCDSHKSELHSRNTSQKGHLLFLVRFGIESMVRGVWMNGQREFEGERDHATFAAENSSCRHAGSTIQPQSGQRKCDVGTGLACVASVCDLAAWTAIFVGHCVLVDNAIGPGMDHYPSTSRCCTCFDFLTTPSIAPLFSTSRKD